MHWSQIVLYFFIFFQCIQYQTRGCISLSAARFEAYGHTQHGSHMISSECTTQENSLVLEANAKRKKMLMPRTISYLVVSLTTSVCKYGMRKLVYRKLLTYLLTYLVT